MLMRHAARSDGKQYKIAGFPVVAIAVYQGVARALEDKNRQATLMAVLTGMAVNDMLEGLHGLKRRVGFVRHEVITHLGVSILHPRGVLGADDDFTRLGAVIHFLEIFDQAWIPGILRLQLTFSFPLNACC